MTVQAPQNFWTVLALPVTKLKTDLVVDTNSIFLSLASDEDLSNFRIHQDQMVVLRPNDFPPNPGEQAGGGRYIFKWEGTLSVTIWNRLWVDQAGEDTNWLTQLSLGTGKVVHNVTDSLEQFMPIDGSGNYYFTQSMRLLPPGFKFPAKKIGEWGLVSSNWSFHWQENLTLPVLSS